MKNEIAHMIDHTLLSAGTTKEQIVRLCEEAKQYGFASVCVNPVYVPEAVKMLDNSDVKVCTVIGFPLGASTTRVKVFEVEDAIENGAEEVDMVIPVGAVKSGDWEAVSQDVSSVVKAAAKKAIVKVIIETCLLSDDEKKKLCLICKDAGADYVKTSTGFSTGGATIEDITLMRQAVGSKMGVKASGGIKDAEFAQALIQAGATRIGTSSGIAIVENT